VGPSDLIGREVSRLVENEKQFLSTNLLTLRDVEIEIQLKVIDGANEFLMYDEFFSLGTNVNRNHLRAKVTSHHVSICDLVRR
jgi:hypothetical protein